VEYPDIGHVKARQDPLIIVELYVPQTSRRSLGEQERIVLGFGALRHLGTCRRIEHVVRHKFRDQRQIHMHRAFQLWQRPDVACGDGEIRVFFKSLGRHDVR
jgi:hypothetical protein